MSRYTREWLERTPRDQTVEVLSRIAEQADLEPRSLFAGVLFLLSWFSISGSVSSGPTARKVGIRAAIMLAKLEDARAISPLARVYVPVGVGRGKYHELVESGLTRVLSGLRGCRELAPYAGTIERTARRIWDSGDRRKDLPNGTANLLIASLSALSAPGMEADAGLLRAIAEAESDQRSRRRVTDAARRLLFT